MMPPPSGDMPCPGSYDFGNMASCWWHSYSSECWGRCGDSADGSAQGVTGGSGRLPITAEW